MSLLRLALSSTAQRACQEVLPALWTAVVAGSTSSCVQQAAAGSTAARAALWCSSSSGSRSFHAGRALFSSDQELSQILAQEVKHEQTVYEQDEAVAAGPPAPFKLTTTPGDTTVTLSREHKGETVTVDASVNMQETLAMPFEEEGESEEEEEEEEEPNDILFNVTVTRGDKALLFECISDGTYVDIRHVSFEPASGVESETSYTGPVFSELDDNMQNGFRTYIAERGISEEMGEYLRHLLYDKEQQEYVRWLEGVHSFVKSS